MVLVEPCWTKVLNGLLAGLSAECRRVTQQCFRLRRSFPKELADRGFTGTLTIKDGECSAKFLRKRDRPGYGKSLLDGS